MIRESLLSISLLALSACAVAPPTGPNVVALPGKDKSFEAFQADDAACRQYAAAQIGQSSPAQAANESAVNSAVLGTAIGAIAGAVIGAATGDAAAGAAIGAGGGLLVGGTTGIDAARASSAGLQQRYDVGYIQCMSAKGENVQTATVSPAYGAYPAYYYPYYYPYYPYYPTYSSTFIGVGVGFHGHSGHFHGHGGHSFHGGHHR
jgi:outer membrane lipoprotein SlyB